tara:strand:- start:703 stop:1209 length:507 start_codon:yes stop_codon:yes gene_type:complete
MISIENLVLKPVCEDDIDIYEKILGSNELTRFLPKGEAYSSDEIRGHVRNRISHWIHGFGSYVIYLKTEPAVKIGYVGVEQCEDPQYSDIRYALLPIHQGKGYVLEAAKAVIHETFKLGKHEKIYGAALRENIASLSIIRKLGMQFEPCVKLYTRVPGLETYSIEKFV